MNGGEVINKIFICKESTKTHNERCLHNYNISHAKYDKSFDWLYPALIKINEVISSLNDEDCNDYDEDCGSPELQEYQSCFGQVFYWDENTLKEMYQECVGFIEWYNEQKKIVNNP